MGVSLLGSMCGLVVCLAERVILLRAFLSLPTSCQTANYPVTLRVMFDSMFIDFTARVGGSGGYVCPGFCLGVGYY